MSRGGRGGFGGRGGRGGAIGPGGKARIGGQEMTWEHDPDLKIDTKPSEMFPEILIPNARPPSDFERAAITRFRALRKRIHDGPFYTGVLGDNVRISKAGGLTGEERRRADFNPFEDMPTYTQKYKVQARRLPTFTSREYQLRFFPKELWDTIDPSRKGKTSKIDAKLKRVRIERLRMNDVEEETEQRAENPDDDTVKNPDDDEEPAQEEDLEENFSEDDSEMGGDYNAEMYFDGGDDDADADENPGEDVGFD